MKYAKAFVAAMEEIVFVIVILLTTSLFAVATYGTCRRVVAAVVKTLAPENVSSASFAGTAPSDQTIFPPPYKVKRSCEETTDRAITLLVAEAPKTAATFDIVGPVDENVAPPVKTAEELNVFTPEMV